MRSLLTIFGLLALLLGGLAPAANAQDCMIGEVKFFAGNFAPRNWAFADGQLLAISQNTALFSILGTIYGGDGRTTFGLPDLRGRVIIGPRQGPGLTLNAREGQRGGVENVTLNESQIPSHTHALVATDDPATDTSPEDRIPAAKSRTRLYADPAAPAQSRVNLAPEAVAPTGGNQSHTNVQPYLAINPIICLYGIFPSRS